MQADLFLSDPPYNVNYTGGTDDKLTIANDNMTAAQFMKFCADFSKCASAVIKPGGAFYIWHADSARKQFQSGLEQAGFMVKQLLVWVKNSFVLSRQDYHWQHEPCLYGWKENGAHYFVADRGQSTVIEDRPNLAKFSKKELIDYARQLLDGQCTDVLREDKPLRNGDHPTMKPVKLIARQIANSTIKGQVVLDLFGGSGTTLIACEQLGRKCFMMEFDPRYVDVIIKRWEALTGLKAIKER